MIDQTVTARTLIARVVSQRITQKAVDLKKESAYIASKLAEIDDFVDVFVRDCLPEVVLEVAQNHTRRDPETVRIGGVAGTRESIIASVRAEIAAGFSEFVKRPTGTERVHVLDLTRRELLEKADERSDKAHKEATRAAWYRKLAEKMADGQTVREVWSQDEIADLRETIHATVTTAQIVPFIRAAAD